MRQPYVRGAGRMAFLVAALAAETAGGQQPAASPVPSIQDNSFLLEEAYNQEPRIVQTIQTFTRQQSSGDWVYTLTQEWPVPAETHQLSFTLPILGVGDGESLARGIGDIALNYRYQLLGNGEAKVACAPRATLLLPTGDRKRGLGSGGFGLQVALPVSLVVTKTLVAHTNLGATYIVSAKNPAGDEADLRSTYAGQSIVWLARPAFNVLVETLLSSTETLGDSGARERRTDLIVSPGVRAALNLPGDVQIVAGLAVPIGVGPSRGQRSLFLYFSVELPLIKEKKDKN